MPRKRMRSISGTVGSSASCNTRALKDNQLRSRLIRGTFLLINYKITGYRARYRLPALQPKQVPTPAKVNSQMFSSLLLSQAVGVYFLLFFWKFFSWSSFLPLQLLSFLQVHSQSC